MEVRIGIAARLLLVLSALPGTALAIRTVHVHDAGAPAPTVSLNLSNSSHANRSLNASFGGLNASSSFAIRNASFRVSVNATLGGTRKLTLNTTLNASLNATHNTSVNGTYPFSPRVEPAVGKVFSLYYSSYSGVKATSVEAMDSYKPVSRRSGYVFDGHQMLPVPGCPLQIRSQTNYATDRREANYRLVELAVCSYLYDYGVELPTCGASNDQVCELELLAPLPSSDEMQEPYIAAAMALAAFSKVCAEGRSSSYNEYKCEIHRSMSVICAGLVHLGDGKVGLKGLPSPGLLDLKLDDAYNLQFEHVYLAKSNKALYEETDYYFQDKTLWPHAPPSIYYCDDVHCLIQDFISAPLGL